MTVEVASPGPGSAQGAAAPAQPANASSGAVVKVTAEQLGVQQGDEYSGQLELDLGNLCAWDPSPVEPTHYIGSTREDTCSAVAQAMTQTLVNRLFSLPAEPVQGGRLAQLPPPATPLPREKPLPKPKPLTKWQAFAQKKGIVKKKRSKLQFDETSQEWRRRHGYKKAGDANDVAIVEARPGDKPGEDPFSRMEADKKERVKRNRQQQADNAKVAQAAGALPSTLRLAASLSPAAPVSNSKAAGPRRVQKGKRKELKEEIKAASRMSGISTASMGKFDNTLKGEKPGERAPLSKRRKFLPVTDTASERSKMNDLAGRFLRERADDILDLRKAIGKHEAVAREERRAAKEVMFTRPSNKAGKAGRKERGSGGDGDKEGGKRERVKSGGVRKPGAKGSKGGSKGGKKR